MRNDTQYWIYENEIKDDVVNKILKYKNQKWDKGKFGADNSTNEKTRKTDIIWCGDQWLYDFFWAYVTNANQKAKWNLDIDCAEAFQLGKYEVGGHYDFHLDNNGFDVFDMPNDILDGKTRKLSMVLWLNEDFEGGEFQFFNDELIKPTKGTLLFFPSWLQHKVHPVTKGTRYSFVTWFCGKPLR